MTTQTSPAAAAGRTRTGMTRPRAAVVLALLSLSVLAGAWQDFTLYYLLHVADLGYVLQGGARIAAGQVPYRDFIYMWPPLSPIMMAASFRIFGESLWAAKLPLAVFVAAAVPLAYRWLRGGASRPAALAGAVLVWATAPVALRLPYATSFTIAPAFFVLWQLQRLRANRLVGPALWAGAACGLTLGLKHNIGLLLGLAVWVRLLCITPYTTLAPVPGSAAPRFAGPVRLGAWLAALGGLIVLYQQFRMPPLTTVLTLGPAAMYTTLAAWRAWRTDTTAGGGIAWTSLAIAAIAVGAGAAVMAAPWLAWLAAHDALAAFLRIGLVTRDPANDWGAFYAQLLRLLPVGRTAPLLAVILAGSVVMVRVRGARSAGLGAIAVVGGVVAAVAQDGAVAMQRALCYAALGFCIGLPWVWRAQARQGRALVAMATGAAWFVALAYPAATRIHFSAGLAPALALAVALAWDRTRKRVLARVGIVSVALLLVGAGWAEWVQACTRRTEAGWEWQAPVRIPGPRGGTWTRADQAATFAELTTRVAMLTPPGAPVVGWPAVGLVNFLTGLPNPTRMDYYWPGYITAAVEDALLAELNATPPATVVLCVAPDPIFGDGLLWQLHPALRAYIVEQYVHVGTLDIYEVHVRPPPR